MHGCTTPPTHRCRKPAEASGRSRILRMRPARPPVTGRPAMTTRAETAPAQRAITKPGPRASSAMARHGVAETLTGAIVLLIALGFLAYAVAHSGRTTGTRLYAAGPIRPYRRPERRRRRSSRRGQGWHGDRGANRSKNVHRHRHADGTRRYPSAKGHRGVDHQRKPAGWKVYLTVAGWRRYRPEAGTDHYDHSVLRQPGGTAGEIHLQCHQPERTEGRQSVGRQPVGRQVSPGGDQSGGGLPPLAK